MYKTKEFDFWKYWAFFAFWSDQFKEKAKEWVDYVDCWMWLIAPKDIARQMIIDFKDHNEQEDKNRLEADWLDKIIEYELWNHECYYTWDINDILWLCETYWTTKEYIREIYHKNKHKFEDLY